MLAADLDWSSAEEHCDEVVDCRQSHYSDPCSEVVGVHSQRG